MGDTQPLISPSAPDAPETQSTQDNGISHAPDKQYSKNRGCLSCLCPILRCKKQAGRVSPAPETGGTKENVQGRENERPKVKRSSKLWNRRVHPEELRPMKFKIVVLGVDGAGKTSLVSRLRRNPLQNPKTSWGFSSATIKRENKDTVSLYDLGGHPRIRGIWQNYIAEVFNNPTNRTFQFAPSWSSLNVFFETFAFEKVHGVIFVVDASDASRFEDARQALFEIYSDERLFGKPLLILANKQDRQNAVSPSELYQILEIANLSKRKEPSLEKGAASETDDSAVVSNTREARTDKDVVTEMVHIMGTRSDLLPTDGGSHGVDASVDIALTDILVHIIPHLPTLLPRIKQSVADEDKRLKIEQEEKRKRVAMYKAEREHEKEVDEQKKDETELKAKETKKDEQK